MSTSGLITNGGPDIINGISTNQQQKYLNSETEVRIANLLGHKQKERLLLTSEY